MKPREAKRSQECLASLQLPDSPRGGQELPVRLGRDQPWRGGGGVGRRVRVMGCFVARPLCVELRAFRNQFIKVVCIWRLQKSTECRSYATSPNLTSPNPFADRLPMAPKVSRPGHFTSLASPRAELVRSFCQIVKMFEALGFYEGEESKSF